MSKDGLTSTGWPRPIIGGLPIPWVSSAHDLSTIDEQRLQQLRTKKLCQVCGEDHAVGSTVYMCGSAREKPDLAEGCYVMAMDDGVLHERCARLAVKMCPRLRELNDQGLLRVVGVPLEDVALFEDDVGTVRLGAYTVRGTFLV
jgi:hypothetical protein